MIGPSIEPSEVGLSGLVWLFFSYGYALYFASNLIGEGSELLLLVPSMAGLVGGVVLPLLGAIPDGAIILFSGLGSLELAQETLSVGVGALAGSTIMLLTVPWALSVLAGRVDLKDGGTANYLAKPKLSKKESLADDLNKTGITLTEAVRAGGVTMVMTTIPYFLIQIPASSLHGPTEEVAKGEHWWSLLGLVTCLTGLGYYMHLQLKFSQEGQDKDKRVAVTKKVLKEGKVSLSGALKGMIQEQEVSSASASLSTEYSSIISQSSSDKFLQPSPGVVELLRDILSDAFKTYDKDGSGELQKKEIRIFFKDFHETISEEEMENIFRMADRDHDGDISLNEFIALAYNLIMQHDDLVSATKIEPKTSTSQELVEGIFNDETEEEELPEEFTDLSPEEQQKAIKKRAFQMLAIGTGLVVFFSDPMVDVMQEIAVRANLSPFYVSFVLAPLASNASEVLASQYYASKKTRKTMTVALTALEGAAAMNNTFCLSIFMGLIFFRGLAWQYTAETIAIVVVELIIGILVQNETMTTARAMCVLCIFPLSLVLVATLEHFGLD